MPANKAFFSHFKRKILKIKKYFWYATYSKVNLNARFLLFSKTKNKMKKKNKQTTQDKHIQTQTHELYLFFKVFFYF